MLLSFQLCASWRSLLLYGLSPERRKTHPLSRGTGPAKIRVSEYSTTSVRNPKRKIKISYRSVSPGRPEGTRPMVDLVPKDKRPTEKFEKNSKKGGRYLLVADSDEVALAFRDDVVL